jgi:hypothetical protein
MLQGKTPSGAPSTARQDAERILEQLAQPTTYGLLSHAARYLRQNLSARTTKANLEKLIEESSKLIPIETVHADAKLFWDQVRILRQELPDTVPPLPVGPSILATVSVPSPIIVRQLNLGNTARAQQSSDSEDEEITARTPLLGRPNKHK